LSRIMPGPLKRLIKRALRLNGHLPYERHRLGKGVEPLSYLWGTHRGYALCRYYLEQFLWEFAADIRGPRLEFHEDWYTTHIGGASVTKLDILHLDDSKPQATVIADLTKPNDIPDDRFDCIVCTHVLHVIYELDRAVAELCRILKPGGVLLVAVPHVSMCDPGWHELWRFTEEGLSRVLAKAFGGGDVTTRAYGNSF